eukprot:4605068-Alexandrium_andersonii.AAC.1
MGEGTAGARKSRGGAPQLRSPPLPRPHARRGPWMQELRGGQSTGPGRADETQGCGKGAPP